MDPLLQRNVKPVSIQEELQNGGLLTKDGDVFFMNEKLKYHRDQEEGPALITKAGTHYYYKNGKKHRSDGPAVIEDWGGPNEKQYWYLDDELILTAVSFKEKAKIGDEGMFMLKMKFCPAIPEKYEGEPPNAAYCRTFWKHM